MTPDVKRRGTGVPAAPPPRLQPFLHDACLTLHAPTLAVSRPDGGMVHGADGFFHGDRRFLSRLELRWGGAAAAPLGGGPHGADRASFRAVLRGVGESTPDPAVSLHRLRRVGPGRLEERLELHNAGTAHVVLELTVAAAADFAAMDDVKGGRADGGPTAPARAAAGGLDWERGGQRTRMECDPAPDAVDPDEGTVHHRVDLPPGASWDCTLRCTALEEQTGPFAPVPADAVPWRTPRVRSADRRLDRLVEQSATDLARLLLADPGDPRDVFAAAGAPWYLTLFGRDSLWAARMLLPLGTGLAEGTLRVLARRQGARTDDATEEQPGRILHEVRRAALRLDDERSLPPCYYGTVDATPLWVALLHDAWRWGLAESRVEELLPHAESALEWMAAHGDADGDGLLEYADRSGRGLANQGWRDSGDAIRHRDGRLADPPVALGEVQAYAYEAAVGGAALLRAFGRPGADRWEEWADALRGRFRERFWLEDAAGPYCASALDGDKRPLDTVTSSMGHLLGTGLLTGEESAAVAARLAAPELDCGFGLRTLTPDATGFNPLGYHIGSVWPHDTAIAVRGLARAGFHGTALSLARGLVAASEGFGARLPELFAGHGNAPGAGYGAAPAPYPAACRPQAWAAASVFPLLQAAVGLEADVPGGRLRVAPRAETPWSPLHVEGMQVAGHPLAVAVDAAGEVHAETTAPLSLER